MREIHRQIDLATPTKVSAVQQIAELLDNLPQVWVEAAYNERRAIVQSLLHDVYVDVDARRVAGLAPTAAFRLLLENAVRAIPGAPVVLIPPQQLVESGGVSRHLEPTVSESVQTSPNLVGLVETGEHQSLPSPNEIRIWERLAFAVVAT